MRIVSSTGPKRSYFEQRLVRSRDLQCSSLKVQILLLGFTLLAVSCLGPAAARLPVSDRKTHARALLEMDDVAARKMKVFQERLNFLSPLNSMLKLDDGDHVTCVPIKDQLSLIDFSESQLQLEPSARPHDSKPRSTIYKWIRQALQKYFLNKVICAPGTYPLRASRGWAPIFSKPQDANQSTDLVGILTADADFVHEHAVAYVEGEFKGADVSLNVWRPYVEKPSEFSLAQVWIMAIDNVTTSSIEAGWQVYEGQFGDMSPRLFTYWTADNYNKTGCYNLDCPGFVQVSSNVLLGGAFDRTSVKNWVQYEMRLQIFQDPQTHNWWLLVNNELVGYWPSHLFSNSLKDTGGSIVLWGGEVLGYNKTRGSHTMTKMGSGAFADDGFGTAAYLRHIKYVNIDNELKDATAMKLGAEAPTCYSSVAPLYGFDGLPSLPKFQMPFEKWGMHSFYGGPGGSATCT